MEADRTSVGLTAYELERSDDAAFSEPVSSGRVESVFPTAEWVGSALESRQQCWFRVRVWTDRGVTAWSDPLRVEGSLFEPEDWSARPISPEFNRDRRDPVRVPLFRRQFVLREGIERARLYVSALGVHESWLNGALVSSDLLEPGWTDYRSRLLFASYDVTDRLRSGPNALAAAVGDGWWRGNLTWMERRAVYGETTALLAQLEVRYTDGTSETIATDESWRSSTGELIEADIYNGCTVDQRERRGGWADVGFDDAAWSSVVRLPLPAGLEQRSMLAVQILAELKPRVRELRERLLALDCGQNLTGFLRLTVSAEREASITVRHAEIVDAKGRLHTAPLRNARATDTYHVLPGRSVLEPSFTYHGFRYAEIEFGESVRIEDVEVCVVASNLPRIGTFKCSDERVNRLYENAVWSQRGNFVAIPTDCPQRDERLGWTGDIQVFGPTACTNFDSRSFLVSWLKDLALEQWPDGRVPSTVPNVIQGHDFEYAGVGWGDAATLLPWAIFEAYGDRHVLIDQFDSMCAWVDWCASRLGTDGTWSGDFHLGDWLDPNAPPDKPEQATTDRDFIATAYLARSAAIVARAATLLERTPEAERYAALSTSTAAAAWRKWSDHAQRTQTGCGLLIEFGVAPVEAREAVGEALARLVLAGDGRIGTGFLGTPLVLPALARTGQVEAAYRLLLNEKAPGWLHQVANGATTMWERWDAIQPGGEIHSGAMAAADAASMISFNHYAYGAVGEWLYRSVAGIAPLEPGYRSIEFRPLPGGGLDWAEATLETPLGHALIRWVKDEGSLLVDLEVPPGAMGRFIIPSGWTSTESGNGSEIKVESGRHRLVCRAS